MKKELVLGLLEELIAGGSSATSTSNETANAFPIDKSFFFRTVTYHAVGRVAAVCGRWIHLIDASWVADSGRFTQAIRDGALSEVELVGAMMINSDAIVDAFPWQHPLPMDQK